MTASTPDTRPLRIAVIAGDGIGREVMPEGLRVLEAAARRFDLALEFTSFDWAHCDYYLQHGQMMPDDWKAQLQDMDAIYFGAVGWPATVPDHVSLWGSLLKFRREFDQYINLRPVRLFEGVPCPLAGRKAGDIDYFVVRENTEGEYTNLGGVMYAGTEREIVIQESVYSRHGTDRVLKYAFELAQSRDRKHLTVATKSNGIAISMPWWDGRADAMAGLPGSDRGQAAHRHPERALRAAAGALRRGGGVQPVRRHPLGPGPGHHRHHRPGALGEPEPGALLPFAVRAGAWLRA
jgi:tartrate dehydrogenase/decarboxylase/D-malate dehydrogenase